MSEKCDRARHQILRVETDHEKEGYREAVSIIVLIEHSKKIPHLDDAYTCSRDDQR